MIGLPVVDLLTCPVIGCLVLGPCLFFFWFSDFGALQYDWWPGCGSLGLPNQWFPTFVVSWPSFSKNNVVANRPSQGGYDDNRDYIS